MSDIIAYHFTSDTLRDGRPIPPVGETLVHEGPLTIRKSGLHACIHPFDAMCYARGPLLHRVRMSGDIVLTDDKLAASERTILASFDATGLLREFACWCASQVVASWDAPDVVRRYLATCDESLREAALAAALEAREEALEEVWEAARAASAAAWAAAAWEAAAGAAARAASAAASAAAWAAARESQRAKFAELVKAAFNEVESE